jgi:hypothetical protein
MNELQSKQTGRIPPYVRGGGSSDIELMTASGTVSEKITRDEAIRIATDLLSAALQERP